MAKPASSRYRKKRRTKNPLQPVSAPTASAPVPPPVTDSAGQQRAEKSAAQKQPPPHSDKKADKNFLYFPPERRSLWPSELFRSANQPYRLIQRHWREEIPHLFMVFFLVLLLYAFTAPHLVTLEDDGLFIANMEFFGVAHPPGYPLHTLFGGIFYHLLPFGTPAFRGHLFSGFAGAIACAAIYACIIMLVRGRVFGYLGGLAYGASKTFWSQAIIAEVYTLNAMFFFITLALCISYASHNGRSGLKHQRLLYIIAFIYGLGIANHYPILFLGSTGLVLLVFSQLFRNMLPNFFMVVVTLLLGAVPPYLWMVWRSYDLTPANFYGPIETLEGFLFYVLRSGYSGVDTQAGVGIEDKIIFGKFLADNMLWQFTPIGFLFVVLGVLVMLRSRYNWLCLSLLVSWFTSSVLLVFLLDFKSSFIWLAAFRVYHLLAYGIMAIWLGVGAAWTVDALRRFLPLIARQQIAGVIVLAVVGASVAAHWEINNRRDYRWAHDLAVAKINSIEPNAALFTFDDLDLPVGYLHFVEGMRPDLTVFNDQGLVYGNRLYSPLISDYPPQGHPDAPNKSAILRKYIDSTSRPIYYHPQRRDLYRHPNYGSDFTGFQRRINRSGAQDRIILSELLKQWLNDNVSLGDTITDLWTKQQHYSTVSQLVGAVVLAGLHGFELDESWQELIDRARKKNAQTRLITNAQYLSANKMSEDDIRRELEWARTYDINAEDVMDKRTKSNFFVQYAEWVRNLSGTDDPEYEQALLSGMQQLASKDNPALRPLILLYWKQERYCAIIALADSYYTNTSDIPDNLLRTLRQARQKSGYCPEEDTQ